MKELKTPDFQGTNLLDRLSWAKVNLKPFRTEYCVVYEDEMDKPAKVMHPDPNWMACALQGGILPPVSSYWELRKEEKKPGFVKHTRGRELLHDMKPIDAMTEEEAIEYQIMHSIPEKVWRTWNDGNYPKMVICKRDQLPQTRKWRNAWKLNKELEYNNG